MTLRYVDGANGNDSWDGLAPNFVSGSNGPKLTLDGAESTPVVAGDLVWVRPNVPYRVTFGPAVSGGSVYSTGTLSTTQGSAVVTGSGTSWSGNAFAGGQLKVGSDSPVEIASVDSNTQITLTAPYWGASVSGASYRTWRDIKYYGDVLGQIWVGGGLARITGSDNDTTATRSNALACTAKDGRTFRGFQLDTCTSPVISLGSPCSNWILEDLFFPGENSNSVVITIAGTGVHNTLRRFVILWTRTNGIEFQHSSLVDNAGHIIENGMVSAGNRGITLTRIGGGVVRNCLLTSGINVRTDFSLTAGQKWDVNNCELSFGLPSLQCVTVGDIVENYNNFWANGADRTTVAVGAQSTALPPLYRAPLLFGKLRLPWLFPALSGASALSGKVGTGEAAEDMFGRGRPVTSAKRSWGPVQYQPVTRSTANKDTGTYGLTLSDAGRVQFRRDLAASSQTHTVRVKFDTNYTGTKPQMIVRQGSTILSTQTATGTAGSGTYETLSATFTPAAAPFVTFELVSNNTDTANPTTHGAHFDNLIKV